MHEYVGLEGIGMACLTLAETQSKLSVNQNQSDLEYIFRFSSLALGQATDFARKFLDALRTWIVTQSLETPGETLLNGQNEGLELAFRWGEQDRIGH
jgi:hypothetical protein